MSIDSCFFFCFFKKRDRKKQEVPSDPLRFLKKQEVSPKKQTTLCFFEASNFTRDYLTRDIQPHSMLKYPLHQPSFIPTSSALIRPAHLTPPSSTLHYRSILMLLKLVEINEEIKYEILWTSIQAYSHNDTETWERPSSW